MSHTPVAQVLALSGGVGGAKLVAGLARVVTGDSLCVVVNTGDDFEHFGLYISPDLDSVLYALGGHNDTDRGWGRAGETWRFMAALGQLSTETWFQLGDQDLAMHVYRTWRMRQGARLSEVTADIAARYGIAARVLPMADLPVRTKVHTTDGSLEFQRYFVEHRCTPTVTGFEFSGSDRAVPPAAAATILQGDSLSAVIICPSNPYVSIRPILAINAWSAWLRTQTAPVIAVSPFVGSEALKGPAAKMMRELGFEPSAAALAAHYGELVDGWVIHSSDADDVPALAAQNIRVIATNTIMRTVHDQTQLALDVLAFASTLHRRPLSSRA